MNIVLYTNSFLPHIGGRELVVHQLALALHNLGHRVRVIGPGGWWRFRKLKFPYPVHRYPLLVRDVPESVKIAQLSLDLALRGCDVLHAHITHPAGYLGARLKRFMKVPLVITPHGSDIHVIPEIGYGLRLDPLLEPKIAYALRNADALTAISDSIGNSLVEAGAPAGKIVNIPNGVDLERFSRGSSDQCRRWLNLPENAKILIAVGNYRPVKGHELLVRAMPRILKSQPDARLVIIGRKNEVLDPLIQNLGLQGKVCCPGEVEFPANVGQVAGDRHAMPDMLAELYSAAEIYLSTGISEGSEGLSLALLEAMAAGLPVIASDISGNRDVVTDGSNGILVPAGDEKAIADAAVRLLENQEQRRETGRRARLTASDYSWETIATQYLNVYRSVCQ